jgi:hypothetical protein
VLFVGAPQVPGFRSTGIGTGSCAAAVLAPECGVIAGRPVARSAAPPTVWPCLKASDNCVAKYSVFRKSDASKGQGPLGEHVSIRARPQSAELMSNISIGVFWNDKTLNSTRGMHSGYLKPLLRGSPYASACPCAM